MDLVPNEDFTHLMMQRAAQTAALALLFVPISTIAYTTIPEEQQGDAAALFSMSRNVFGGLGISLATALVTEHEQTEQQMLVAHLVDSYQPYEATLQQIQRALVDNGTAVAQAMSQARLQIDQMLRAQTAVLAYADVYFITALLALVMVPAALLMSGVKTK
jgi:DHA2 family multidrug resistance protein